MTHRGYHGHLAATSSTGISVSDLAPKAFGTIDQIAREYDVSRAYVTKAVLERLTPEAIQGFLLERFGQPKRTSQRYRLYGKRRAEKSEPVERAQDRVCREIHGSVPAGGCRYPNCDCKG